MKMQKDRQKASELAKEFINETISFKEFANQYPMDTGDIEIDNLFDLIEHQPKIRGIFGVRKEVYNDYKLKIFEKIENLSY